MIGPRQPGPLLLALVLGVSPALAQPAPATPVARPADATADETVAPKQAPAATPAPKNTPAATGKDSPFDYRPSEEISEDLPVAFPVDI